MEFAFTCQLAVGSVLSLLSAIASAGSGIGGGCFYLVIFVLILQMDPHVAIPLSKITTFGVACGGFLVLFYMRHPKINYRLLISYPIALMVEPLTIYGTMIGVIFNIVSPNWLIIVVLVLLLGFTVYRTFKKAVGQWKKESETLKQQAPPAVEMQAEQTEGPKNVLDTENDDMAIHDGDLPLEQDDEDVGGVETTGVIVIDTPASADEPLPDTQGSGPIPLPQEDPDIVGASATKAVEERSLLLREVVKSVIAVIILVAVWLVMFGIVILRGGDKMASIIGVECGSLWYWVMTAAGLPIMLTVTVVVGVFLRWRQGGAVVEGEVNWSLKNSLLIPVGALFAGISAAYLGIGGGMVIGPLLLEIGVLPQVSTATSSFMIMFTASSSSLQYMIDGKLDLVYGAWYFGVGLVGAVIGQFGFSRLVKRMKRQSIVSFFLGTLIVLSTIAMLAITVYRLIQDIRDNNLWFQPLCPANWESTSSFDPSSWSDQSPF